MRLVSLKRFVSVALVAVLCLLVAAVWHLFGWRTVHLMHASPHTEHRFLGRVTKIKYDGDLNGQIDGVILFSWDTPWLGLEQSDHCDYYLVEKRDTNSDGQWDEWLRPVLHHENGECLTRIEADTDHDGLPDRFTIIKVDDPPEIGSEIWQILEQGRDQNPN